MMQATAAICPHCQNHVAVVLWAPTVEMEQQALGAAEEAAEPEPPKRRKKRKLSAYNRFIRERTKGGAMTIGEAAAAWKAHKANGKA